MKLAQLSKTMGQIETLKIYGANALAFLSTFTTIDAILKIALLVASIAYTVVKTWLLIKDNHRVENKEKDENQNKS